MAAKKGGLGKGLSAIFLENENESLIIDALRYWRCTYHVDGFHLKGSRIPVRQIVKEPLFTDVKIWYDWFDTFDIYGNKEVANTLGCSPKTVERKIKAYREAQQQTDKIEHNLKEKEKEKNKDTEKKNHTTNVNDTYNITKNTTENESTNDDKKYKDNIFSDLI